jgi:hypothetical protein
MGMGTGATGTGAGTALGMGAGAGAFNSRGGAMDEGIRICGGTDA